MLWNLVAAAVTIPILFFIPARAWFEWMTRGRESAHTSFEIALTVGIVLFVLSPLAHFVAAFTLQPLGYVQVVAVAVASLWWTRRRPTPRPISTTHTGLFWMQSLIPALAGFASGILLLDVDINFHLWCTYLPPFMAARPDVVPQAMGLNVGLLHSSHQRMGVSAAIAPWLALYGVLGLRVFWGLVFTAVASSVQAVSVRLGARPGAAAFAGLFAALMPGFVLEADQNRVVLAYTAFIAVAWLVAEERPFFFGWIAAGAFGAEPVVILGALGVAPFAAASRWGRIDGRWMKRSALGFAVGVAPFVLRWLMAFDHPVIHEHFSYMPKVEYRWFGSTLELPAFLNWPFIDQWVRSPFNPWPNLVLLPLILAAHFGVLGLGLVATGSRALLIRSKPAFFATIGFAVPLMAFLAVNENWTQKDKWGIVTMTYFPLLVLVALGLTALTIGERRSRAKAWLAFVGAATGVILIRPILLNARAPEDSRFRVLWSEKHQRLNAEEPVYLELERRQLSAMDWIPGYRFLERIPIRPARPSWAVLKEEFRTRDVTQRVPSIAERIMTPLIPPSEIPWLPSAALPYGPRRGPTDAVVHEIDLSRSPATVWKSGASVLSAPLSDESTTHLRVGAPPIPLVVPWRSEPVHVYLVDVPEHDSTILVLVRDVPFELSRSRRLATHLYSADHVVLNYPAGRRLMLLDVLTADPARYYLFDVDADHGALAIRTY